MLNAIDYIHKYPHRSKRILGISYQQFRKLCNKQVYIKANSVSGLNKCLKSSPVDLGMLKSENYKAVTAID